MKTLIIMYLIFSIPGIHRTSPQEKAVKDTSGWKKIGITTLNFKNSIDEIYVLESDKYSSVKFSVNDSPIDITDLVLYYETGDKQDIKVNLSLNGPGESQIIELAGGERRLSKIAFAYRPSLEKYNKKAVLELWGTKLK